MTYVGRFAPSPTGPLHAGSLTTALASWLDARAHGGLWLVRIEDIDTPRCTQDAAMTILKQLDACGLHSDLPVAYQSAHETRYENALAQLHRNGLIYRCLCTRGNAAQSSGEHEAQAEPNDAAPKPFAHRCNCRMRIDAADAMSSHARGSLRFKLPASQRVDWHDRLLGRQTQDVASEVGDFVLRRADGLWSYQLAVVVDDAAAGISHVVRGADLADNTPRQIVLQQALGVHTPAYMHTPLVKSESGQKLSKQNHAPPIDSAAPLAALRDAAHALSISIDATSVSVALEQALQMWRSSITGASQSSPPIESCAAPLGLHAIN